MKYIQLALAGVAIVEQTMAQDAGATKKQKALDIINNEAQLVGAVFPGQQQLAGSIVNMTVSVFNLIGLFQHKPPVVSPTTIVK